MSDIYKKNNVVLFLYVGVSLLTITLLIIALYKCDKKVCDNYHIGNGVKSDKNTDTSSHSGEKDLCLCAGSGKVCANRANLLKSYIDGNNEYKDFVGIQKKLGGPFWKNTNFNQY